jgi:ribosomal protein L40E
METLKILRSGICVGCNERTSVGNTECSSICLHCSARVSELVIVLSDSPCEIM